MTDATTHSQKDADRDDSEDALLREVRLPFATARSVFALMLREMATSYGRSPGGYVWAVLEPAAGITLLTLIFSAGFRNPPLGTSFPLFYATGLLAFMMYMDISHKISVVLNYSRALLEYPRVTFLDAIFARLILNVITQFLVHFLVMGMILLFLTGDVTIEMAPVFKAYIATIILAAGIGTLNCFLVVAYPVWQTIWAVLNRPLFLVSCIFFLFDSIPRPYSDFLWFNPLVHIVGAMRDGFYPYYHPTYVTLVYPITVGTVALIVGLFLLNRYHRDILDI